LEEAVARLEEVVVEAALKNPAIKEVAEAVVVDDYIDY
jgi:hypothetical protein